MVELLGCPLNPLVLPHLGRLVVTPPPPPGGRKAPPLQGCSPGWGGRSSWLSEQLAACSGRSLLPAGLGFPGALWLPEASAPPFLGPVPLSWWPCSWGGRAGDPLLRKWLCALPLLRGQQLSCGS